MTLNDLGIDKSTLNLKYVGNDKSKQVNITKDEYLWLVEKQFQPSFLDRIYQKSKRKIVASFIH